MFLVCQVEIWSMPLFNKNYGLPLKNQDIGSYSYVSKITLRWIFWISFKFNLNELVCLSNASFLFLFFVLFCFLKETIKVMLTCRRSLVRRLRSLQIYSWAYIGHNVWPCNLLFSIFQKSLTGQPLFIQYIMWFEIYQSNFKDDIRLIIFHYIVIQRGFVILVLVGFVVVVVFFCINKVILPPGL